MLERRLHIIEDGNLAHGLKVITSGHFVKMLILSRNPNATCEAHCARQLAQPPLNRLSPAKRADLRRNVKIDGFTTDQQLAFL